MLEWLERKWKNCDSESPKQRRWGKILALGFFFLRVVPYVVTGR